MSSTSGPAGPQGPSSQPSQPTPPGQIAQPAKMPAPTGQPLPTAGARTGAGKTNPAPGVPGPYVHKTPWTAYIKPTVWVLVALWVVLFVFLNTDNVTINFIFAKASVPLIFVLVAMTAIGAALCAGVMISARRRSTRRAQLASAKASGQIPSGKAGGK